MTDLSSETLREVGWQAKVSVTNCVKRHHTRMFAKSEPDDKLGVGLSYNAIEEFYLIRLYNVFPGTAVENAKQDLFLLSQSALQRTVRPCHYSVVKDENKLSEDNKPSD